MLGGRRGLRFRLAAQPVPEAVGALVLRAFGADPDAPESLRDLKDEALEAMTPGDAVTVDGSTGVDGSPGAVLVVEDNGYQGTFRKSSPARRRAAARPACTGTSTG